MWICLISQTRGKVYSHREVLLAGTRGSSLRSSPVREQGQISSGRSADFSALSLGPQFIECCQPLSWWVLAPCNKLHGTANTIWKIPYRISHRTNGSGVLSPCVTGHISHLAGLEKEVLNLTSNVGVCNGKVANLERATLCAHGRTHAWGLLGAESLSLALTGEKALSCWLLAASLLPSNWLRTGLYVHVSPGEGETKQRAACSSGVCWLYLLTVGTFTNRQSLCSWKKATEYSKITASLFVWVL